MLATLLADTSILPVSRSPFAKMKVLVLRYAADAAVGVLGSRRLSKGIAINSNSYLSNGVVLRAV